MSDRERIEELERRVRELEARPFYVPVPYQVFVPYWVTVPYVPASAPMPWQPIRGIVGTPSPWSPTLQGTVTNIGGTYGMAVDN